MNIKPKLLEESNTKEIGSVDFILSTIRLIDCPIILLHINDYSVNTINRLTQ